MRGMVEEARMESVRHKEVHRRAGVKMELASTVDQGVLRWFGHVERTDKQRMAKMVKRS